MSEQPEPSAAHDFDFWIGSWDVFGPQGRQVGTNEITPVFRSGAIAEHWHGRGGVEGRSMTAYDVMRGTWHQTWVDSTGTLLRLDGGLQGNAMVLEGVAPADHDLTLLERQRITWTPHDGDAEVRQLWEASADDGDSWRVVFDGRYRRRR